VMLSPVGFGVLRPNISGAPSFFTDVMAMGGGVGFLFIFSGLK